MKLHLLELDISGLGFQVFQLEKGKLKLFILYYINYILNKYLKMVAVVAAADVAVDAAAVVVAAVVAVAVVVEAAAVAVVVAAAAAVVIFHKA